MGREGGDWGEEGRQTKREETLVRFETSGEGGSEQAAEQGELNEGVMKLCRWGQVIY